MKNRNLLVMTFGAALASSAMSWKAQPRALKGSALPRLPSVILGVASVGAYGSLVVSKEHGALHGLPGHSDSKYWCSVLDPADVSPWHNAPPCHIYGNQMNIDKYPHKPCCSYHKMKPICPLDHESVGLDHFTAGCVWTVACLQGRSKHILGPRREKKMGP